MKQISLDDIADALRALLDVLPEDASGIDFSSMARNRREQLRKQVIQTILRLESFGHSLDPIRQPSHVFDPSDPEVIGRLIGDTLLEQPRIRLDQLDSSRFYGSGVYAIYSRSDFPAYKPIRNTDTPIYVGKADPKTNEARTPKQQGDKLWQRLVKDHAKSIRAAENLVLSDFDCRYLVVKSAWQRTAEDYLIALFKPIWNNEMKTCFGFGKHGDAPEKRGNTRSPWDTLHPGRPWATREGNLPNPLSPKEITLSILRHYKMCPPQR